MGKNEDVIVMTEAEQAQAVADLIDRIADNLIADIATKIAEQPDSVSAMKVYISDPFYIATLKYRLDLVANQLPNYDTRKVGYVEWLHDLIFEKVDAL